MVTLQEARELCGIDQEEAAQCLEMSKEQLQRLEGGQKDIPASTLMRIRRLYGIPLDIIEIK